MKLRKHLRGVTLLELMIVVVIIGILAAVGYPNYREFVARAKRTEATAALMLIAQNQERFYLQNNTYTTDLSRLGFADAADAITDSESYMINVTAADANGFSAQAVYQNDDTEASKCGTFTINGAGERGSSPYTDCWSRTR